MLKVNSEQANGKAHPKAHGTAWLRSRLRIQIPASSLSRGPAAFLCPLHLHDYPREERGSPAAEQLAIGKMDYFTLLSPCLALPVCIFKLFPPPRHLLCRELQVLPAERLCSNSFVREYKYPSEEDGNRSTGTEPSLGGKLGAWK